VVAAAELAGDVAVSADDYVAIVLAADLEWARTAGAVAWQTLSDERARKIAGAVAAAEQERIARQIDSFAANYPEDVFTAEGTSRDAIGGTAMRHAYRNAARSIREGKHYE